MTKISKILVVVSAIASMIFLGVAVASYIGGPNWRVEANELEGYTFERGTGPTPSWSVKSNRPGPNGQVFTATNPVLADVIVKARNDQLQKQREELGRLDQEIPIYESRVKQAKAAIDADILAMAAREKQLAEELNTLSATINDTTNQAIAKAQEAEDVRKVGERRREDVFRVRNLLAEVRTDKFRAIEQQKKLEDLLVRLNGQTERLERRKEQLNVQLAGGGAKTPAATSKQPYEEDPKAPAQPQNGTGNKEPAKSEPETKTPEAAAPESKD